MIYWAEREGLSEDDFGAYPNFGNMSVIHSESHIFAIIQTSFMMIFKLRLY